MHSQLFSLLIVEPLREHLLLASDVLLGLLEDTNSSLQLAFKIADLISDLLGVLVGILVRIILDCLWHRHGLFAFAEVLSLQRTRQSGLHVRVLPDRPVIHGDVPRLVQAHLMPVPVMPAVLILARQGSHHPTEPLSHAYSRVGVAVGVCLASLPRAAR